MILSVEPIAAALEAIAAARGPSRRILLTPAGRCSIRRAHALCRVETHLTLICGRYEGIDERATGFVDEELRIGDFVLAGGEVAAAAVIEAVARLVPGVLGCALSASDESFSAGRLEYPQWTRPATWNGQSVPGVLLSGDHQAIARWRHREALKVTRARRPDLIATHPLSDEERRLLGAPSQGASEAPSEGSSDKDT